VILNPRLFASRTKALPGTASSNRIAPIGMSYFAIIAATVEMCRMHT
jgi:hypothetical protein